MTFDSFSKRNELEKRKKLLYEPPPPQKKKTLQSLANFLVAGGFGTARQTGLSAHYKGRMIGHRLMCKDFDQPMIKEPCVAGGCASRGDLILFSTSYEPRADKDAASDIGQSDFTTSPDISVVIVLAFLTALMLERRRCQ